MTREFTQTCRQLLHSVYGYDEFWSGQQDIIATVAEKRNSLVIMPTGGGKSLCYQLPALASPGVGIVISPLIALMQDQVSALIHSGVSAAFLNSSLSRTEQFRVMGDLIDGRLKLLYIAPEGLLQPGTLDQLSKSQISLIAIDEAHCVSQWGHDFRKEYLELGTLTEVFPGVPIMALTATANAHTRQEIIERLRLGDAARFVLGFDRPNIRYSVVVKRDRNQQLLDFLDTHRGAAGIVYCLARKTVDETANFLLAHGYDALPYHAGLSTKEREFNQRRFLRDDGVVIVATIAFGMGIDKPNVRFVAHADLPMSMEAYYQETGRAGRDREPAEAWMMYGLQDVIKRRQLLELSAAGENHKRIQRENLNALLGWCEVTTCRRAAMLMYFGDDSLGHCGNCDVCLSPPQTWDGTEAAQKLLSCIFRVKQNFGVSHLIDVLRGRDTAKVRQHRHNELSTYNIGAEIPDVTWRSIARQLLVQGFIYADFENYGVIKLMPAANPLLRGEISLKLRNDPNLVNKKRGAKTNLLRAENQVSSEDVPLWEALRECRRKLADEAGVPAYIVFSDRTLQEFVHARPRTNTQMLSLHGVGDAKIERYGPEFLKVIAEYESP